MSDVPQLLHTVLDALDVRGEAEFWRELLALDYRPGDAASDAPADVDWLVLTRPDGRRRLAIQEVASLSTSRWPQPGHPSVSHLDTTVPTRAALDAAHERVLALGGELRLDRTDDPDEPLRAYASPAGHVFCIFVDPPAPDTAPRSRAGTCAFRLMPTDDLADAPSTLSVEEAAAGRATVLTYTWLHPDDGAQSGTLLLGLPADDGAVAAAWVDSWHQRDVVLLTGTCRAGMTSVGYDYAPGWRWEIDVVVEAAALSMVMRTRVPEADGSPAGAYDVMRASWA